MTHVWETLVSLLFFFFGALVALIHSFLTIQFNPVETLYVPPGVGEKLAKGYDSSWRQ